MMERKTEVVDSAQKELEFLHGQNASLTQKWKQCSSSSIVEVIESFENALQQVEHFHLLLIISREQICPNRILQYGRVFSFL